MMISYNQPFQEHAYSRYTRVTERLIHTLQDDFFSGRTLGQSVPGMSVEEASVIVAESLKADQLWATLPETLSGAGLPEMGPGPPSDWRMATMAELFFAVAEEAKAQADRDRQTDFQAFGWAMLEEICKSPTASPMLQYEDIFYDVGDQLRRLGEDAALEFFDRALVHNLHHDNGHELGNLLRDLAETHLWLGDPDQALGILTTLLRNDPADIWTYNLIALTFDHFGLTKLRMEALQRGMALLEHTGDPQGLRDQFVELLKDIQQGPHQDREAKVDSTVLNNMRASLTLDFDSGEGRPLVELCRELVSNLDRVPVKKPLTEVSLSLLEGWKQRPTMGRAQSKPGRNDLCWCGSGKKYKYCHGQTDRR
jgi:tetratricopeptide (TPR) repeat protein